MRPSTGEKEKKSHLLASRPRLLQFREHYKLIHRPEGSFTGISGTINLFPAQKVTMPAN